MDHLSETTYRQSTDNDRLSIAGSGRGDTEVFAKSNIGGDKIEKPPQEPSAGGRINEAEEYPRGFVLVMLFVSVLSSLFLVALVMRTMILAPVLQDPSG